MWFLRESGTVTSPVLALALGMALSLLASGVGRFVWEKQPSSEDLLFNELMVWGYIQRCRKQRRLADSAHLLSAEDASGSRRQQRLLERLVSAMETRDPYLHGHSRRVARHSWMIAQRMKLPREEVARIRAAAALHDVGKTKTPKTILHKPGRLSDEEYRIIQLHPGEGAEMVAVLGDAKLAAIVRHHHERLDGSGYPDRLAGEAIPLGARIIAVADTFDAVTSARPYRAASAHKKAIDILREESGTRLDPDVVKAFCANYAGRGPLALWSFVSGLPERIVAWLSTSVGAVASAAKVVAVAAVAGGAAVTGSTLASTPPAASHPRGPLHVGAAARAATGSAAPAAAGSLRLARSKGAPASSRHAGAPRHARGKRAPVAAGAPVLLSTPAGAGTAGTSSPSGNAHAGGAEGSSRGEVAAPSHHEESAGAKREEAKAKHEEAVVKKEEPKAKHEEAVVKKEEPKAKHEESPTKSEEHGKSSESPGHIKKQEAAAPPSGPAPVAGTTEEPAHGNGAAETVHGKSGEAPGHNKG